MIGLYSRSAKSSVIFPTDTFDFGRMQEQLEFPDRNVPRWCGHGLSLTRDLGIGLGSAERTGEKGLARFGQSTFRSTIPHLA